MVIDTSALLAVLLGEAEAGAVARAIEAAPLRLLSAASLLEASIVIESRKGEAGTRELDLLLYRAGIEVADVDLNQAEIGRGAWRRFGKGRHEAALNYGDCFAYALARSRDLPLLFVGDDFARTDVVRVALG
ncbi:MAG: type II toxin-antitoxin system VapC family toxin [Alphaproteobacteria bacterium]|nr:type II toxin-antitoxin system VapC family toxin [Alphaproteobacteria bacterium]